ncbi:response regulator [Balneolaceae bacterium ANBcel3]|nr:response regulator [Balneolaceae bacterium ANBcel3]
MSGELKILLVEDEVLTAILMKKKLEKSGYQVAKSVTTGEHAISAVKEMDMDIVLMDIRLAGEIDGIEAAEMIQNIRKTPIIFITGYDDTETKERAETLKPLAYLNKPVDFAALLSILEDL